MKKQISTFICFYLTVPGFVLVMTIIGSIFFSNVTAESYISGESDESDTLTIYESTLFPAEMLEEIPFIPEGLYPIVSRTIRSEDNIINETAYTIDEDEVMRYSPCYNKDSDPLVLVIHTHGTECYYETDNTTTYIYHTGNDEIEAYYDKENAITRTLDRDKNVVAVGNAFCEVLQGYGIGVIHCSEMFDRDDYNGAYSNSANAIKEYLTLYPTLKLVIDIHRDSLVSSEFVKIKTRASDIGQKSAQVMIVAGSNAGGSNYPDWERSLALDLKIKEVMDKKYPSLARPILLRKARYNQHLAYTSFLLEVGTCGNTLDEAVEAAKLSAECVADAINSYR